MLAQHAPLAVGRALAQEPSIWPHLGRILAGNPVLPLYASHAITLTIALLILARGGQPNLLEA